MKTLKEFIDKKIKEFEAMFGKLISEKNGDYVRCTEGVKIFLSQALEECAREAIKAMKKLPAKKGQPLATEDIYYDIGWNAARTEANKKAEDFLNA